MQNGLKQTAVIMAGGQGERFWPQSRKNMPKQFLSLTGDGKTLFQLTVERMCMLVAIEDVFVVTNKAYKDIIRQQVPQIPVQNILCEPCAKNTAPAIAFAAAVIKARYQDAVMYVVPSDHIIKGRRLYTDIMQTAAAFVQKRSALVTLGVTPTYPETGYGYIRFGNEREKDEGSVYKVESFVEKPNLQTAQNYLEDGNYLWNSGMFIWTAQTFLSILQQHQPGVADMAREIEQAVNSDGYEQSVENAFNNVKAISVDYAVLEKADNVYTIPSSFLWNDVGGWRSMEAINPLDEGRNATVGNTIVLDSEDSIFISGGRLVAAVGVHDIVVVETPDAILVCGKDNAQDVKKIVGVLKEKNMHEYL